MNNPEEQLKTYMVATVITYTEPIDSWCKSDPTFRSIWQVRQKAINEEDAIALAFHRHVLKIKQSDRLITDIELDQAIATEL